MHRMQVDISLIIMIIENNAIIIVWMLYVHLCKERGAFRWRWAGQIETQDRREVRVNDSLMLKNVSEVEIVLFGTNLDSTYTGKDNLIAFEYLANSLIEYPSPFVIGRTSANEPRKEKLSMSLSLRKVEAYGLN